ncbi:unnamed protein product [Danaus chrysippus]|uniref:(African queen) hypothetical protein n=1 Tax=Danaus chrysippus TaxID=151541 RepID=A0A8J2REL7_9NEOP|nr:unnamed protein product [Danaus chrysippus]
MCVPRLWRASSSSSARLAGRLWARRQLLIDLYGLIHQNYYKLVLFECLAGSQMVIGSLVTGSAARPLPLIFDSDNCTHLPHRPATFPIITDLSSLTATMMTDLNYRPTYTGQDASLTYLAVRSREPLLVRHKDINMIRVTVNVTL